MSNEAETLQNDEVLDEVVNTEDSATPEEIKPEPTPEEVEADKKAKTQDAFNKQYGKARQAERERDAANEKLRELEASQQQSPVEVGAFPEEYDYDSTEDFEKAKNDFAASIRQNAIYEANQQLNIQNQQQADQLAQQQQAQSDVEMASALITKAQANNITESEVQQYSQSVINYGINPDVFRLIASDDDGSLMLKHLAANSQDVAALSTINQFDVTNYINTVIKPKAAQLKPKSSEAPPPTDDIQGGAVDLNSSKYPHSKGAKFE